MIQLSCENVALGYDGNVVMSNLSFKVHQGDYLCIVGDNGSGKSTLMKGILNLKAPMSGKLILGEGVKQNEIGYLPQQTSIQKDFPASVKEVVRSGCLNRTGLRPFYNEREKQMAMDNMKRLGISDLVKKCYRELSGGQQQRVLLARALCATQKLLLLDEPVAGLDPTATEDMYQTISELNQSGITIIMISHDIEAATKHSTHILHLGSQKSLFFGTIKDYLDSDVGRVYGRREEL
jgi:zinc transport system ATP-binding protein